MTGSHVSFTALFAENDGPNLHSSGLIYLIARGIRVLVNWGLYSRMLTEGSFGVGSFPVNAYQFCWRVVMEGTG